MRPDRVLLRAGILLALFVVGCSRQEAPTSPSAPAPPGLLRSAAGVAATEQVLGGHRIVYAGRAYSGTRTTFAYVVTRSEGSGTLSHFTIQIPECAPDLDSYSPASASAVVNLDPASGLYGITWGNLSLGVGESKAFTITFPGDVIEGLTRVAVKAGSSAELGVLPGPCAGFIISGVVFDDPDSSGTRDAASELGIPKVTVSIYDANGLLETASSGLGGHYSLRVLDAGTYAVRIDGSTPATDFNEKLFESFFSTTPVSRSVTVGPDVSNLDFGFKPRTRKIITDFAIGALASNGEDAGFWAKTLRSAIRGRSYGGLDPEAVRALLTQIEGSFLSRPYQFTDGNELAEALDIVTGKPKTAFEELYKQVFIAELNDASGKGLIGNPDLQDALLAWGESLIVQNWPGAASAMAQIITAASASSSEFGDATELFRLINNTRGGGDIPQ